MIQTNQIVNIIDGDTFGKVTESKINSNKLYKLYNILSGLYKNIYSSIIREYCSNAWDSMKMAGKEDDPILVDIQWDYLTKSGNVIISDTGLGMSPQIMESIYFNYLDSTKEETNEVIGCFGLGSKSALAYHHTFFINTIFEGIEYKYMFSKQSNGIPAGELLSEAPTDKCNGTTITIPIKTESDASYFHNAAKEQLLYFPNVVVKSHLHFDNDYKLYEHDLFYFNTKITSITSKMHLVVGSAYYKIDYSELGINPIDIPIAIKFNIGELMPTPSREDIIYSKHSIALIKDRIIQITKYLEDAYNKTVRNDLTISEYEQIYRKPNNYTLFFTSDICVNLLQEASKKDSIIKLNKPAIKYSNDFLQSKTILFLRYFGWQLYNKKLAVNGNLINITNYNNSHSSNIPYGSGGYYRSSYLSQLYYDFKSIVPVYPLWCSEFKHSSIVKDCHLDDKLKNKYLAEDYTTFIHKINVNYKLKKVIISLLKYLNVPKKEYINTINNLVELADEYVVNKHKIYSKVDVPQYFIDNLIEEEKKAKKSKLQDDLSKKEHRKISYDFIDNYGYWKTEYTTISNIRNIAYNIIYFEKTDRELAKGMHYLIRYINGKYKTSKRNYHSKDIFTVISIAKSHLKPYANDPNVIFYKDFLEIPNKLNIKLLTAYKINKILKVLDHNASSILTNSNSKFILDSTHSDYMLLKDYMDKYYYSYYTSDCIYKQLIKLDNNLIDIDLINKANKLKLYANKLKRSCTQSKLLSPGYGSSYNQLDYELIIKLFELENIPISKQSYIKSSYKFNYK